MPQNQITSARGIAIHEYLKSLHKFYVVYGSNKRLDCDEVDDAYHQLNTTRLNMVMSCLHVPNVLTIDTRHRGK